MLFSPKLFTFFIFNRFQFGGADLRHVSCDSTVHIGAKNLKILVHCLTGVFLLNRGLWAQGLRWQYNEFVGMNSELISGFKCRCWDNHWAFTTSNSKKTQKQGFDKGFLVVFYENSIMRLPLVSSCWFIIMSWKKIIQLCNMSVANY